MEVQRTLGQDCQYLVDLLLTKRPTTVAQLMHYLGVDKQVYSARRLQRMLQIMAYCLAQLHTSQIEPTEVAYFLRLQCKRMLHKDFSNISIKS